MAETEHEWVITERPPGSIMPLYRCARTGVLGRVRGRILRSHKTSIIPYKCSVKGCQKAAVGRKPGLLPSGRYNWTCEDHQ